jgi:hypothetical protein
LNNDGTRDITANTTNIYDGNVGLQQAALWVDLNIGPKNNLENSVISDD